jgi:hypothetical protein
MIRLERSFPSAAWDAAFVQHNRECLDWNDVEPHGWEEFIRRLPLVLATTARDRAQTELVAAYLRDHLR